MNEGRIYNRQLAERLMSLLSHAPNPKEAMDQLAQAAEQGGLISNSNLPRRESPAAFATDLLVDNPAASEWTSARLNLHPGTMPPPTKVPNLEQVEDLLK